MNDNNREQHEPIAHSDEHGPDGHIREENEAHEVSGLAQHGDPSRKKTVSEITTLPTHGVMWVRPSELMAQAGGRIAGRGIDIQAELARRATSLPAQVVATRRREVSDRARRLPPATAFGSGTPTHTGAVRPGIGLR
ncbi:hypothetical protein [Leifsonia aquatica]|uniref:hypothetical protein n=1 Tax=Leifsonia aquatica TaxID=144185 RepID=UPI0028ADBFAD|nr:hypothetical protein [Leifsonia aquatica]